MSREKKVMELVGFLGSKEGEVVNLGEVVYITVTNILSNALFSIDFLDFEGQGIGKELRKLLTEDAELGITVNLSDLYPILSGLDFQGIRKKSKEVLEKLITIWEDIIKQRRKQESVISDQSDFLDALIKDGYTKDQINQLIVVIQEVFAAEKWVEDSRKRARLELELRQETEKSLGQALAQNEKLTTQLAELKREKDGAEANLRTMRTQVEGQRKLLRQKDEKLSKAQQEHSDLKKELAKMKDEACTFKDSMEAAKKAAYKEGVVATEN
ncbi:hypothetical protein ACB092_12G076600 [Castanea dentata]